MDENDRLGWSSVVLTIYLPLPNNDEDNDNDNIDNNIEEEEKKGEEVCSVDNLVTTP